MSRPPGVPPHRREQCTGGPFVGNLVRDRHARPHVVAAISVSDDLAAIIVRRNSVMNAAIPAFRRRMPNVDGGTRERTPIHACHAATHLPRRLVLILVAPWKTV